MKIVIIEDERLTADDLADTILQIEPTAEIAAKLLSVKESISFFSKNTQPDLIFSDIQLGDGLSFEIFTAVTLEVPVIFCTAFNEYALNAFKANGIDYLLKPFTTATVGAALQKFRKLTQPAKPKGDAQYEAILKLFASQERQAPSAILVHYKDKILPIKLEDTAVFYLDNEVVHMVTFDNKLYYPGKSLEDLEKLVGNNFFRANRQYLLNRKAVVDVSNTLDRKLWVNVTVPLKERITVSKEKSPLFLNWLAGG